MLTKVAKRLTQKDIERIKELQAAGLDLKRAAWVTLSHEAREGKLSAVTMQTRVDAVKIGRLEVGGRVDFIINAPNHLTLRIR